MLAGGEGAFDRLSRAVAALRKVEAEINEPARDPVFAAVRERPYGMTIGRIEGGVWTASTPHELAAQVRFGFGRDLEPAEVQERMRAAVGGGVARGRGPLRGLPRPRLLPADDRAARGRRLRQRIARVAGSEPEPVAFTATNDSRYVEGPCLCYGPFAGNLHGTDEWVDVESLVRTATVMALVAAAWTA